MAGGLIESFSGIRGIYGQELTGDLAYKYGMVYHHIFHKPGAILVVAGDSRKSTSVLKKYFIRSFQDCGAKKIFDLGVVPIQVAELAIIKFKAQGGVYISASHNEPEFNGWKLLKQDGALFYPRQIDRLIRAVHQAGANNFKSANNRQIATVIDKHQQAIQAYIRFISVSLGKQAMAKIKQANFKIIFDPNGGAAISVIKLFCQALNIQAKIVNSRLGQFGRKVEPNVESLGYLSAKLNDDYLFAAGFDCDADRVEFVLPAQSNFAKEMGVVLNGNYVLALACDARLAGTKNQIVVTNDVTSYLVRDVIKKYQAKIKEVEVGEMVVVKAMGKYQSVIGGEGSNGGIIVSPIKCRDGLMSIALILKMLAIHGQSLSEILAEYPKYYSSHNKVVCQSDKAIDARQRLIDYFKNKGYKIRTTGGITGGAKALLDINTYTWWRQSKTEPGVFRIYCESDDKNKVDELARETIQIFNKL